MKRAVFITPEDARYGFRLAGARQVIASLEDIETVLNQVLSEKETGIVILDERLSRGIDMEKLRTIEERWFGLFLILPAPERPITGIEDYAISMIRRAIGYHVRIQ
ncbi:MAG: V-type ATP synthase subunit F [Thermodesulfovibrionales bacterium]